MLKIFGSATIISGETRTKCSWPKNWMRSIFGHEAALVKHFNKTGKLKSVRNVEKVDGEFFFF